MSLRAAVSVIFVAVSMPILLGGCGTLSKPRIPRTVDHGVPGVTYTITEFTNDKTTYKSDMDAASQSTAANRYERAKIKRDEIIFRIKGDIDAYYREYESILNSKRAAFDISTDLVKLALAAGTTITNGARGKTILGAISSFVQGGTSSVNDNFFREKTTPAIISQMQANRTSAKNEILKKMALTPDQYTLEEAWDDLTDYFYQGTLIAGIVGLTNSAGADATAKKKETEQITRERLAPISAGERAQAEDINAKFFELRGAKNFTAAREALMKLGEKPSDVDALKDQDVFPKLLEKLKDKKITIDDKMKALGLE